jgi:regulator of replication initiation timing
MSLESGKLRKKLIKQEKDLTDYTEQNIALIGENMTLVYENKKLKNKIENIETMLTKELARELEGNNGKSQCLMVIIA